MLLIVGCITIGVIIGAATIIALIAYAIGPGPVRFR